MAEPRLRLFMGRLMWWTSAFATARGDEKCSENENKDCYYMRAAAIGKVAFFQSILDSCFCFLTDPSYQNYSCVSLCTYK